MIKALGNCLIAIGKAFLWAIRAIFWIFAIIYRGIGELIKALNNLKNN